MAALRQASVAVTVKSRVVEQPAVVSACVTLIVAALQVSEALEAAATLASSGKLVGLQPRASPVLGTVKLGPVVSTVHVYDTCSVVSFRQASLAVTVKSRVVTQPAVESLCVALIVVV